MKRDFYFIYEIEMGIKGGEDKCTAAVDDIITYF
jgi:hypothetical protein